LVLLLLAFNIFILSPAKRTRQGKTVITGKIIRALLRGRQKLKLPANKTQIQSQSTFGKPGYMELRSSSQLQAIQKGKLQSQIQTKIVLPENARAEYQSQFQRSFGYKKQAQTQSQIQTKIVLPENARAEYQSQIQRSFGYKKQAQTQSQYNLGGKKGRIFESRSENQVDLDSRQHQSQRQSFDTSKYDEQSQSISRNMDSFQSQSQDLSHNKMKTISSTKVRSYEKLEPISKHYQYQSQWTGGSFSHTD